MSNVSRKIKKQSAKTVTSQQAPNDSIIYASYIDKIKAFIVDLFMIYTPILYAVTYVALGGKEAFQNSTLGPLIAVLLYGIIYAIFLTKTGQTPGKKAYRIKVVDEKTHQNISFLRALVRFVMFLFGVTILIGVILPLYHKEKKALHDIIARTIEIKET